MIAIREAQLADINAIQALYKELDRHHVELLPDTFRLVDNDIRNDESIGGWIQAEDRTYFVAISDGQVVGLVSVVEKSYGSLPMYVPQRYGLIDNAVVASGSRRGGIGAQLFDAAIIWLQARGVDSAQVQVWNRNTEAMKFYSKQGFAPIYTRMQVPIAGAHKPNQPTPLGAPVNFNVGLRHSAAMETYVHIGHSKIWVTANGQGLPCILCNGGPGCDDYLGPVSSMIEDVCRVIRFEPRGCGRSDYDQQYEIEQTVHDVEAICNHFGHERIVIGGHSAGVDIALAYTIKHPTRVSGLFGIAGGRIVNDRGWNESYKRNLAEVGEDLGGKEFSADPKVNEMGNRSWREYIKRETLLSDIANINCPALFVNAEKDIRPNWPTKQLARLMKNGGYCEIKGAAHMIWLTHANELRVELRRFIAAVTAAEQVT